VDAFSFKIPSSEDVDSPEAERNLLRPIVEFNARFTLGIVAIGLIRRALAQRPAPLGLAPGERRAVLFALSPPSAYSDWTTTRAAAEAELEFVSLATDAAHTQAPLGGPALLFAHDRLTLRKLVQP
jgi:hypothetical protein